MKTRHAPRLALSALAAAAALSCIAQQAVAQEATTATAATARSADKAKAQETNELPTVTVTATRVSTGLLQTPVAVTAVTQEKLTREGVTDVRGLSGSVPNLQISTGADSGVQMSIRGVSSNNFTEIGDPAVGLHVGGLYSPRPQGAMALMFDLEQVEVLRGPQGTLFGRNSTAGSVNIIPAKPEFGETYGTAEVDVGSYNKRQVNVVQNFGLSDKLALRATFSKVTRDGWINQMQDFTDVYDPVKGLVPDGIPDVDQRRNQKVDKKDFYYNKNQWAARLSARAKLTPDLEGTLSYEKFQNNGAGELAMKDCDMAAGTAYACKGGKWDAKINVPGKIDMSIDTVRGGLVWNLNKTSTVEYNFAYADQRRSQQNDDDGGYHPLASQITVGLPLAGHEDWGIYPFKDESSNTIDSKYISTVHELQFKHKSDTLQYVLGGFWMHEKNQINYALEYLMGGGFGLPYSVLYAQPDRKVDSKALYGQADWKFAPTWTATLGARFSWDKKTDVGGLVYNSGWESGSAAYYNGDYNPGVPGEPGFRPHTSKDLTKDMGAFAGPGAYAGYGDPMHNDNTDSWKKLTYRLGLMNQITPKDMVYGSLATGYKAGGFGDREGFCLEHDCIGALAGKATFMPYKPETVTNLEFGYKGLMLNNRLSLSATAFFSKYKDMQVTGDAFMTKFKPEHPCDADTPLCDVKNTWQTLNVGVVDIKGLELEVDYKPWAGGRIGAFFSYLSTKMKDYPNFSDSWLCDYRAEMGAPACPPDYVGTDPTKMGRKVYDITGNQLPLAPKFSLGFSFSQDIMLGSGYRLTPWVNVKWQDKMYFTLRNLDNAHISDAQKAYTKIDASLKLVSPKNWHVEAYVLNLGNVMSRNSVTAAEGWVKGTWNDPRVYGIRAGIEY